MKKTAPLLLALLLTSLGACAKQEEIAKATLLFGQMHGDVASWYSPSNNLEEDWANLSYLTSIDYAGLSGLIDDKEDFIIVCKGNNTTCSCWQGFHRAIGIYAKAKQVRIYVIEVDDLMKGSTFYGLHCARGVDDLAIFKQGSLIHSKQDKDWGSDYVEVQEWLSARINLPKMFHVDEDQLSQLYDRNEAFFIYFQRGSCGDCQYIERTGLKDYLLSDRKIEANTFVFDADIWRSIVDESGVKHDLKDTTPYDGGKTWGEYVSECYASKKAEFGMADEETGYEGGSFPTFYHVSPLGDGTKTGDVIDMAGVFYNDRIAEDKISATYFTEERLTYGCLDYLASSNVAHKVLTGLSVKEGTSEKIASKVKNARQEGLKEYHEPILKALLDAAILVG